MTSGKKFSGLVEGGKRDGEGAAFKGAVVKFRKFVNAGGEVSTDGKGPKRVIGAQREFFPRGLIQESLNIGV